MKTVCDKCNREFRNCGFANHYPKCKGPKLAKKIRGVDFDPNRGYKDGSRTAWNKGLTKETSKVLKEAGRKISKSLAGKQVGKTVNWKPESLKKLSMLQSARLLEGYATGKRKQSGGFVKYFEVHGRKVQGTWELRAAKILVSWQIAGKIKDWQHGITRVPYLDINGVSRTYIVDFTVTMNNGQKYLIEVKGRVVENDKLKWEAARKIADLEIWNLETIKLHETSI